MKRGWLSHVFRSELIRNTSILLSGNVVGQAIAFLMYPILTRLYSESDFGFFAQFTTITGLLGIISTGKYYEALMVTTKESDTISLFGWLLKSQLFFFVLLFPLSWGGLLIYSSFADSESLGNYWFLIPFMVLFIGLFSSLTYLSNKEKKYKPIASANIYLNVTGSIFKVLLSFVCKLSNGLIIGNLIGQIAGCLNFYTLKNWVRDGFRSSWRQNKAIALRFKNFPRFSMSRDLVNSFSANFPFLIFPFYFGEAQSGLYFLAFTLLFRPINVFSSSLYPVFFEKFAKMKNQGKYIFPMLKKYLIKYFTILFPCFLLAFFVAKPFFRLFLGDSWEISGVYFRMLLPWIFMSAITTPLGFIPILYKKQSVYLYVEIAYLFARLIALAVGVYYMNFSLAIGLFSLVGFIFMSITLIWYIFLIKKYKVADDGNFCFIF